MGTAVRLTVFMVFLLFAGYGVAYLATPYSQFARTVVWLRSDVEDFRRFPAREVRNAPPVFRFTKRLHDPRYSRIFENAQDWNGRGLQSLGAFLEARATTAFLVIHDDVLIYEGYFNGYRADSTQTSFSMAKSFVSALVGCAIADGHIGNVNDPITRYIPELSESDSRFGRITIRHLLTMSSGIRYVERGLPWSDDATTYYAPDLRAAALSAEITGDPGQEFLYNNYNPLLIGIILERATGRTVSEFLEEKIWKPLGMEAAGSWSLDSGQSRFEKMESGINGRAIDFAKFGRLYMNRGSWEGKRVLAEDWVEESTRVDTLTDPAPDYQYFWWVAGDGKGGRHFSAQGRYGQFIYLVPEQKLLFVRFGRDSGGIDWPSFFEQLARRIEEAEPRTA